MAGDMPVTDYRVSFQIRRDYTWMEFIIMPDSVQPCTDKTSKGFQPPQLINIALAAVAKWVRVRSVQLKAAAIAFPKTVFFVGIGLICILFEGE